MAGVPKRDDPAAVVLEYFERVGNGDQAVAELFSDDAVLIGFGSITRGRASIMDLLVIDDGRITSLTYFVADEPQTA